MKEVMGYTDEKIKEELNGKNKDIERARKSPAL
jgi:hypothetical protein